MQLRPKQGFWNKECKFRGVNTNGSQATESKRNDRKIVEHGLESVKDKGPGTEERVITGKLRGDICSGCFPVDVSWSLTVSRDDGEGT